MGDLVMVKLIYWENKRVKEKSFETSGKAMAFIIKNGIREYRLVEE